MHFPRFLLEFGFFDTESALAAIKAEMDEEWLKCAVTCRVSLYLAKSSIIISEKCEKSRLLH